MLSFLIYFPICWVSWFIFRYAEFPDLFSDMLSFSIYFAICWVSWFISRYDEFPDFYSDMLSFLISIPICWVSWFIPRYAEFPDLFPDMLSFLIYFPICWVSWFISRYAEFSDLFCDMLSFLIYFAICCNRIRTRLERYCVCFTIISLWFLSSCKHLVYLLSDTLFRTSSLASIIGSLVSRPFLMVKISFRRSDWLLLVAI